MIRKNCNIKFSVTALYAVCILANLSKFDHWGNIMIMHNTNAVVRVEETWQRFFTINALSKYTKLIYPLFIAIKMESFK